MAAWSAAVVVVLLLLDSDGQVHTDVDALVPEQGLGLELLVPVLGLRLVHIQLTLLRREGLPAPHDLGHARLAGERRRWNRHQKPPVREVDVGTWHGGALLPEAPRRGDANVAPPCPGGRRNGEGLRRHPAGCRQE